MARTVYSLRIFGHASLTSAAGTVGPVVPANFIYVLRDLDVVENTGTRPVSLEVINGNLGLLLFILKASSTDPAGFQWQGRQVYGPGEQVGFKATSGSWSIAASGYQLTLP